VPTPAHDIPDTNGNNNPSTPTDPVEPISSSSADATPDSKPQSEDPGATYFSREPLEHNVALLKSWKEMLTESLMLTEPPMSMHECRKRIPSEFIQRSPKRARCQSNSNNNSSP
jgi:hypothetical protein